MWHHIMSNQNWLLQVYTHDQKYNLKCYSNIHITLLAEILFIYIAITFVNGSSIWIFSGSGLNQQHQLHLYIWFIHSFWRVVECGKCFRLHYYVDLFDVCQIWQKIKRITVRYMFDWISNANYRKYILKIVFNIYAMTLVNGFEVPIWDWKQQKNIT